MAYMIARFNATRFFLLGHKKSLMYQIPVDSVEDLLGVVQEIQQTSRNGASVQEHDSLVQCVQRAWWLPYRIAVVVDKY